MRLFLSSLTFGRWVILLQVLSPSPVFHFLLSFCFSSNILFFLTCFSLDIVTTLFRVVKYYDDMEEELKLEYLKVFFFFSFLFFFDSSFPLILSLT